MQNQNNLDTFVSELITAKDLQDDEQTHAGLLANVSDRINQALLEALPKENLDLIENTINNGTITEDIVTSVLENSGIDAESIITKTLEDFRDSYLSEEA